MTSFIELKHQLHVLTETQFKQISDNNITVNNIVPIICLSTVKRNFLSITMEINSSLRNNSMVSLSGGDSSESSNMVLLFLATYNKNIKKGSLINQYINIYCKNRFNINASVSKKESFWNCG